MFQRSTLVLIVCASSHAQSAIQTRLLDDLGNSGAVRAVRADSSGNLFAAGTRTGGGFVAKLDADFKVLYNTLIPGDIAQVNALALDASGNVYVAGSTQTTRFVADSGRVQPNLIGCTSGACLADAFLAKLDGTSGELVFLTYLGGHGSDAATSLAFGADSTVYMAGTTSSSDFPLTPGAAAAALPAAPAGFLARIAPDGRTLVSSTYFNGAPSALAIDGSGTVFLTGQTSESLPGTPGVYQLSTRHSDLMTSSDGGQTWANLETPSRAIWVEPDPGEPGVVYAATVNGLLRSADGGGSWARFGPFEAVAVTQVRVDPASSRTIYATALTDSVQLASGASSPIQALWKTTNGGDTWTKLLRLDSFDSNLRINLVQPSTLYLTLSSNKSTNISRDGGVTWTSPPVPGQNGLIVDGADGNVLYAGTSRGLVLYHSADAGQHWDAVSDPFPNPFSNVGATPILSSGSTILYTSIVVTVKAGGSTYTGMRRSSDNGKSWSTLEGVPATAGFVDLYNPANLYVTGRAGLFVSVDRGGTWRPLRANMDNPNALQVAFAADGVIYALAMPQPGAFVAKLDGSLSHLVYYTCYGDSGGVAPSALVVDPEGRAIIAGTTTSRRLPVTVGQTTLAGYGDGFVARFSADGASLDFATFIGGASGDSINGLALSANGDIYAVGGTTSSDFPLAGNPLQPEMRATVGSGFISVLAPDGGLKYSTFLGGGYWDAFVAPLLSRGKLYLGGQIGSPDFPGANFRPQPGIPTAAVVAIDLSSIGLQ